MIQKFHAFIPNQNRSRGIWKRLKSVLFLLQIRRNKMTRSWEYAVRTKELNPIDDEMFRKMAEDQGFCEEILRVILRDDSLKIEKLIPQNEIKNLQGRSVILDAVCFMRGGFYCHVEVQKKNDDDHARRVRYNGASLTANITDPGIKFEQIPDVYIVYISKSDIFDSHLTLCHVDSVIRETGEVVDDGLYRVFVNATIKDGSDVSKLMDVFTEDDTYDFEKFPKTSERKRRFKVGEEGQREVSETMERICREIAEEIAVEMAEEKAKEMAEEKAKEMAEEKAEEKAKEIAKQLLDVLDIATIAVKTGLKEDEVRALQVK